jgi:hypothetical protein
MNLTDGELSTNPRTTSPLQCLHSAASPVTAAARLQTAISTPYTEGDWGESQLDCSHLSVQLHCG